MGQSDRSTKVAIIGGGPGGLAAAKYLKAQGFEPVIFEGSDNVGGQWNASNPESGVWPSMRTNTSRVMTRFSDLDYPFGTAVYPTNQEVQAYLRHYANRFGLTRHLRLNTRVERLGRCASGDGWEVLSTQDDHTLRVETFSRVVVASGRYNRPTIPPVPGLGTFTGHGGVVHTFGYKNPSSYRGMRVLVAGCSISALEIASDLAMLGALRVVTSFRRQRYVVNKLIAGVPTDHVAFTRYAALSGEVFPPEVVGAGLKAFVTRSSGSPEQFGAPKPAENVFEADITQSQYYLPLVAEGRIVPKPWMEAVEGSRVRFADGSEEEFDAIVFGTGYELNLPFLDAGLRHALNGDGQHIDLHDYTFHPDLEGLAFVGLYELVGPYFPVLELQARWVAYCWGGLVAPPSRDEMREGLAAYGTRRGTPQKRAMQDMALLFARASGVEPDPYAWPSLTRALLFGPLAATSFRLSGPESQPDAAERYAREAEAFGAIRSPEFTAEEIGMLEALEAARDAAKGRGSGELEEVFEG